MPRKLDLRSGRPVWSAYRAPAVPTTALARDAKADVLVIGMGISGAMIAEALTADGRSVVCIDRRGPLRGSTSATTALVQFEIDQPLTALGRMIGKASAEQAWRRSRLAVSNLAGRIAELSINCRLSRAPRSIWPAPRLAHRSCVARPRRGDRLASPRPISPLRRWLRDSASSATAPSSATAISRSIRAN